MLLTFKQASLILAIWILMMVPCFALAEDIAIVTGIGDYGHLPTASLPGIENDVAAMDRVLARAGFHVIKLWNASATESGIRNAFAQAANLVGSKDRFVYYQSSHGTSDHHLLTFDTTTSGEHTLGVEDIRQLVGSIRTRSKSLILDACFSGGIKGNLGQVVKFYPIGRYKDVSLPALHDRTDTVTRLYCGQGTASPGNTFVPFASSQENEYSLVMPVGGKTCSIFTFCLASALDVLLAAQGNSGARNHQAIWSTVVQSTVREVLHQTQGRQNPVFESRYLSSLVFTTETGTEEALPTATASNLGQIYDICNVSSAQLELMAQLGSAPDRYGRFQPQTSVVLRLHVAQPGYLFLINRDDEDNAQMVGWGRTDLDYTSPEHMVEQSYLDRPNDFEMGQGTLRISTSSREGEERWKAFLFTSKEQAQAFAKAWCDLTRNKGDRVQPKTFALMNLSKVQNVHLGEVGEHLLFTSQLHYRVTDH